METLLKTYRYAELFCGAGGLSLGATLAKYGEYSIKPIWALDNNHNACETYSMNIGKHVVCKDARELCSSEVPDHDGLGFGFPCNDFSSVGEQKGLNGAYGNLYKVGVSVINEKKPIWFLAENVDGLSSSNGSRALPEIIKALRSAGDGYSICAHLYKFEEYGVPQSRHRIIIVGIRGDIGLVFRPPSPSNKIVTVRQALEVPPIPEWASNQELTRQSQQVIERLKHIPPGKNAWCEEIPNHLRLKVKGAKLSQIYRRLDPDKPSYTVTGSGGGGTHVYHWSDPRALTNRERARIQTFPDNFTFCGQKGSVRKQIGMAVPPSGAKVIFKAILMTLAGDNYPSVIPNLA